MEKGLIYQAKKNRKVTILVTFLIIIFGLYSYNLIPKQEKPDVSAPIALITTIYPGASPEDVERLVVSEIEDEVKEIKGYDYCSSEAKNSLAIVILELDSQADIDKAWNELRQKMEDLQSELPEECYPLEIDTDLTETAGIIISISGENYSYEDLTGYAENLEKELTKVPGISRLEIIGEQKKEIKIIIDYQKLNHYNLSADEVAGILNIQNIQIPSGAIRDGDSKINVTTPAMYTSLKEIENLILDISEETGALVYLKDIAEIKWDLEEDTAKFKYSGQNSILLTAYFADNLNIVSVGKEVAKVLDKLKKNLPSDLAVDNILFQPHEVHNKVNDFIKNLLFGMILVIIVVLVGMNLRNALIISTAIPLSILMTFIAMFFLKIKVHEISIAGLIIALGMLVDNAIVISDAIQVKIDNNMEKLRACIEGARESAIPIFTSTLTTITAFIPLILISGTVGEYVFSIPATVIIATLASYLTAMLITPCIAYIFFKESSENAKKQSFIRKFFNNLLQTGLTYKKTTLLIALGALGFSLLLSSQLGLVFFPHADKDIIYIDITSEIAADIDKTALLAEEVENILKEQEEITAFTTSIGDGIPKFFMSMMKSTRSPDYAQIMIRVNLAKGQKFKTNEELVNYLQDIFDNQIPEGTVTAKLLEQAKPIGAPVKLRVSGEDMDRLVEVAENIKAVLHTIPGTINIRHDAPEKVYEYMVNIDADKASQVGITKYDVQKQLNISLKGYQASIFRKGGENYNIIVKSNIESQKDLGNLGIKSSITGKKVLLKQIAQILLTPQRPTIKKYDGEKTVTVFSDVEAACSPVEIENILEKEKLPELNINDVNINFAGEREEIKKNFGAAGKYGLLTIFLIYFILVVQFNSFTQPFIILTTVPLSIIGSILGLFILQQPMSFTALLGMISLIGLVVKNAILLIEYINYGREKGMSAGEAARAATDRRFKPIMLSTVTTVMGLIPLALSGSSLFVPMSISLMSGLLVATLLTLIITPIMYVLIEGLLEKVSQRNSKKDSLEAF